MKYLTKGELLITLGADADKFTAFMLDPSVFGITEPMVSNLKVAKQKLDWTNTIDLGLPEIAGLIQLMIAYGVISQPTADAVMGTPDRKEFDEYLITVKAQDEITPENIYGVVNDGNAWVLRVDFKNVTKNEVYEIYESFDTMPDDDMVQQYVNNKIIELKGI